MALQRELWSSREQMIAEEKAMLQTLVFHSLPPIQHTFFSVGMSLCTDLASALRLEA